MTTRSKSAFGNKDDIETAKQAGTIDAFDVLYLTNGEVGWINKAGETVISTPRTQNDIVIDGASDIGVENGTIVEAGKSLDEIAGMILQNLIPGIVSYVNRVIGNENPDITSQLEQCLASAKTYTDASIASALEITEF